MLRSVHGLFGLAAGILVSVVAVSGTILAFDPVAEELSVPALPRGTLSTAELAARATAAFPGIEKIERRPSGAIMVTRSGEDGSGRLLYDPRTGATLPVPDPGPAMVVVRNLHRSLLLDDPGRAAAGILSLAMLVLGITGSAMLARRLGGWRRLAGPILGTRSQRLHAHAARLALAGLVVSAASGLVMSASTFELLPDPLPPAVSAPSSAEGSAIPVGAIPALAALDAADMLSLAFPDPSDAQDTWRLVTAAGEAALDRATGAVLGEAKAGAWPAAWRVVYALHTGTLAWPVTLALALSTATVPLLALTGTVVWFRRRRARPAKAGNAPAQGADTLILVGSEGNTSWGFATDLAGLLAAHGRRVHLAPMKRLATLHRQADLMIVVTATYGDGTAPASADRFLQRLARFRPRPDLRTAVLGLGDRQFPRFCAFADAVEAALAERGLPALCETGRIDRQSAQTYRDWCGALGDALGITLRTAYLPPAPRTARLVLRERLDYGSQVGAPVAILRFAMAPGANGRTPRLPAFEAGDLVGILPPGASVARFYSLATSRRDGVLEICVRLRPDGECSPYLHALRPGDGVDAFVRSNPGFRPAPGSAPVILVGAGTGIAPLAGFIRHNAARRPMHLYFGARHPQSDFLYESDLAACLDDHRLTRLSAAFSRTDTRRHVHHSIAADADAVRALLARGGQVVVCGGREMGRSVAAVLASIVEPLGLTLADLRREGRYVEDVY